MKIGMILAVAALAVAGCGKKDDGTKPAAPEAAKPAAPATAKAAETKAAPVDPKAVAVEVNGKKVTFGEINADVEKIIAAQKIPAEQTEEARKYFTEQLAQQFAMKTILLAEVEKKGVKVTEDFRKKAEGEMAKANAQRPGAPKTFAEVAAKHPLGEARGKQEIEDSLKIQSLLEQEVISKVVVDAKKVDEMFTNITSNYEAQVKAALDAQAKALPKLQGIKKQLDGLKGDALKTKFAELAKANSDCPSKDKGGDLGEFTADRMVKEFSDVAFKLEPFVVSDPVKTQFGYHLIMVTKKIPAVEAKGATPASPAKVQASHILVKVDNPRGEKPTKDQIQGWMKQQEQQKATRTYIEALRSAAKIVAPTFPSLNPPPPPAPAPAAKPATPAPAAKPAAKVESKPVEVKPAAKPAPAPAAKPAAPAAK